jgi:hypothetical protein
LFEREHHRRIAAILHAFDAGTLAADGCLFGGGTAITLRYGEYRESVDIDFVVSDHSGYRALRERLTGPEGIHALSREGHVLVPAREIRADQYGIRTALETGGGPVKFEIILEGRIPLDPPAPADVLCGVSTLTPLDMTTTKLLANSDRWADDGVFSRDLIDLAMMTPTAELLERAIAKAQTAYGSSVTRDLSRAVEALRNRPGRLDRCMQELHIDSVPKALLWKHIRRLAPRR